MGIVTQGDVFAAVEPVLQLLAGADNLREVILFPMTQRAEDLMMNTPAEATLKGRLSGGEAGAEQWLACRTAGCSVEIPLLKARMS